MYQHGKTNKLLVPGAEQALEQFKYEIAQEFGVSLDLIQHLVLTVQLAVK